MPRLRRDGQTVLPGHLGSMYMALNSHYLGRGTARRLYLLPDATVLSDRARNKIRHLEQGWRGVAARLERLGARPLLDGQDPRAWLATVLEELATRPWHRSCHRYAWSLDRRVRLGRPAFSYPERLIGPPAIAAARVTTTVEVQVVVSSSAQTMDGGSTTPRQPPR